MKKIKYLIFFAALHFLICSYAFAQTAFSTTFKDAIFSFTNRTFYTQDPYTGTMSNKNANNSVLQSPLAHINAIGYNRTNNFVYGVVEDQLNYYATGQIAKMGSDFGNANNITLNTISVNTFAGRDIQTGDVNSQGYLYVASYDSPYYIWKIDVNPDRGSTYLTQIGSSISLSGSAIGTDWAFPAADDINAYGLNRNGDLVVTNVTTGVTSTRATGLVTLDANAYNYGAYFDNSNNLYIASASTTTTTTKLFKITNAISGTPSVTTVSTSPGSTFGDAARNPSLSITLPVVFGPVGATYINDALTVNWSTETEKNNSHFVIEASKDGKTFVAIDSVKTKALNGNSSTALQYSYTKTLGAAIAMLGMPATMSSFVLAGIFIAALLLLAVVNKGSSRRKASLLLMLAICTMAVTLGSCKKQDPAAINNQKNIRVWVRITQVDNDGTRVSSQIVEAVKQ